MFVEPKSVKGGIIRVNITKMRTLCFTIFFNLINNYYISCSGLINASQNGTTVSNGTEGMTETQYATCRIATEELVANAQATVTRVLTGVCSAEAVEERFENLERTMKREFDEIKEALNKIARPEQKTVHSIVDPRQEEIDRYNNTIITVNTPTGVERKLIFYILVENFEQKVSRWESGMFERSSTLYTDPRRYAMYVKIIPRYVNGDKVYVNVGVGLTRGIDDAALDWPFSLKYQIEILDHSARDFRADLTGPIIDPLISGSLYNWERPGRFGNDDNPELVSISVPTSVIFSAIQPQFDFFKNSTTTRYIWKGDLTVKLTVHL